MVEADGYSGIHNDERGHRFIQGQVKVKRMWDPIRAHMADCHFCGKRIKYLHKYARLEPSMDFIYLAHVECYALYIMTHNIRTDDHYSPAEIWGASAQRRYR